MNYLELFHQPESEQGTVLPQSGFLQAEGQTRPLACCLPHAGGWKCGQGQATRWVVACRGASEPLDGAASRWHEARSEAEGTNTHGSLQGHADAPLPGRMLPCEYKLGTLGKYKFGENKTLCRLRRAKAECYFL